MEVNEKIYIAGHSGLVGASIVKNLRSQGYNNLILKTHGELDLINQSEVEDFFRVEKPDYVFLAAAKVGGIYANSTLPAEFIYDNLMIQNNVINSAYRSKVKKLLFLGSSCIYPRECRQPMREEDLMSSYLEPTNEAYALAKISGLKMCEYYNMQYGVNFISCMPTNIYGPNDNFDEKSSHVIPAMIRRFHNAKLNKDKTISVWGTGTARREFLYVDDLAEACIYLMENYSEKEFINVGTGNDISIRDLAFLIREVVGYEGEIVFDTNGLEGNPQKLLDVSKLSELNWRYKVELIDGLKLTYEWFLTNIM